MNDFIEKANELLTIQGRSVKPATDNPNTDNAYMCGMYNGMELLLAMAEGRDPKYKAYQNCEYA